MTEENPFPSYTAWARKDRKMPTSWEVTVTGVGEPFPVTDVSEQEDPWTPLYDATRAYIIATLDLEDSAEFAVAIIFQ